MTTSGWVVGISSASEVVTSSGCDVVSACGSSEVQRESCSPSCPRISTAHTSSSVTNGTDQARRIVKVEDPVE